MKIHNTNHGHPRNGIALLYSVFGAFVAAGLVSVLLAMATSSTKTANVKHYGTRARYLAEGAVEAAKKVVQDSIANFRPVPATGTSTIYGEVVPYTVAPTGFTAITTDPSGIQTIVTGYSIEATGRIQGHQALSHRLINAEATPVFQFAVFYTNDLEILPGPDMELGGRVHTNRDMYLGCGGTLTCNTNYLRAVGDIYRRRKDNPLLSDGTVAVRQWVADPFDITEPSSYFNMNSLSQMAALGVPSASGYDSAFTTGWDGDLDGSLYGPLDWLPWGPGALEYWQQPTGYAGGMGNTVLTSAHGIGEAVTPQIGSISMFEALTGGTGGDYNWDGGLQEYIAAAVPGSGTHNKGYYHGEAGLTILTMADRSIRAYDQNGLPVALPAGVVNVVSMFDARQAGGGPGKVQITNIDVAALNASGYFPPNGLLYAASYGAATGLDCDGIRLTNGSDLHGPLTVVSQNSMYIQGDYNTVNKKGASVIADAVNLLSNNWTDAKTSASVPSLPAATQTTYNVAMVCGNQDTAVGAYNGGLENLPRFHENWTNIRCYITGSFVNTWTSQFATGGWVYGGKRYTAPKRFWGYDPMYNNVANLPPYTPMAVSARDIASW